MKSVYIQPQTDIFELEIINAIAASTTFNPKVDFGSEGTYAPSVWVNESYESTNLEGFDVIGIENDDAGRSSRANSTIWE